MRDDGSTSGRGPRAIGSVSTTDACGVRGSSGASGVGVWAGGVFDTFVGGGEGEFAGFAAGDVYLRFTPVPEPSTYALLGLGGLMTGCGWLRRRRA